MDSGNSGSLQSSSGGDEEYDSCAAATDSVSAFISGGHISNPPPPFFDSLSNYLQLHQNPNTPLLNPNPVWPRLNYPRSDPNPIINRNINMLPSSSTFVPSFEPAAAGPDTGAPITPAPPPQSQNQTAARNPKKRSRASRRAPTTVLTTDTANFRAMVQEFTGIPAPPFDSSPFPRNRLDLFGSRSLATSYDAPPPSYLRRPFPQKVQPTFASTSAGVGAAYSAATTTTTNTASAITSNTIAASSSNPAINSLQIPITQTSPNLFQNPFLNNFLQTNPKFQLSSDLLSSRPVSFQISPNDHSRTQFGLSGHGNNFIPSNHQISLQNDRHNNAEKNKDEHLSASGFHHGGRKRPENNVAGEGIVESWICSSE